MYLNRLNIKFSLLITLVLALGLGFLFITISYSATDTDGDGYDSSSDCTDSLQSVYKINDDCDTTATPTLLASYDDPDGADDIADHTWIQDADGLWHLFFQWNLDGSNNTEIGHFTSTDLKSLTKVGTAIENVDDTYYESIWAPHVIENNDVYYMFFTGVERFSGGRDRQRMGLATSTDLTNWNFYHENLCNTTTTPNGDGCLYECANDWTTWNDGGAFDEQCRDPMILRDEANNRWLALNTVKYDDATGATIDVAESTDLINWTGIGYVEAARKLWNGEEQQQTGGQAENPFITEYNGKYILIFSDWADTEPPAHNQYIVSDSLEFDDSGSTNWEYIGPIDVQGVNANEVIKPYDDTWIISGSISNANSGYGDYNRYLYLRRMLFNDDGTWTSSNLTDLDCRVDSSDINPGATEICTDGLDNNCSGEADEDSVCNPPVVTGGAGPAPPPAIGSGGYTVSIGMGKTGSTDIINTTGANILLYIGSSLYFGLDDKSHNLFIKDLDMINKKVTVDLFSEPVTVDLNLHQSKEVDLDGDNINDLEITFSDLIINRIEITIKKVVSSKEVLEETEEEVITEEVETEINPFDFSRDLKRGTIGEDVRDLQQFLNNNNFILTASGFGSPGQETDYFGPATQGALIKFQETYNIYPAWGYFGPITKGYIQKNY